MAGTIPGSVSRHAASHSAAKKNSNCDACQDHMQHGGKEQGSHVLF